ncbi:MSC_0621 family F1-like ATPase epsilon subunit [Mycoplasma sp. 394]
MSKPIEMIFLDNKKLRIKNYDLYINHYQENTWIKVSDNSIGAYPRMLIKLVNPQNKNTFFMFLKNVNIVSKPDKTLVNSFSNIHFFKVAATKQKYKKELDPLKYQISRLKTLRFVGLSIDETILLDDLKNDLYELELKQLLNLTERETYE